MEPSKPEVFTAKHEPPIESVLLRTIYLGGHEDEQRIWRLMENLSADGAMPAASYGLLLIGSDSMVYHHSTTQNIQGKRSVVCSIPGSPFAFVCAEDAIRAKPFGQQSHEYFMMKMRQQGFEPCPDCKGQGQFPDRGNPGHAKVCDPCEGRGFVAIKPKPAVPAEPSPAPVVDKEFLEKASRLMAETGFSAAECEVALRTWAGDYEKALKWLDDSRLGA